MPATALSRMSTAHRDTMEGNPWFSRLPAVQRDALIGAAKLTCFRRGAAVFHQGEPAGSAGSGLYGLAAGTVKISTVREDGREAILTVLEPGNWFGEISLIDGSERTHDATALTALDVLVVSPRSFAELMRDAAFASAMTALLAARVRGLYALMEDATLRGLRARVARRLIGLAHGGVTRAAEPRGRIVIPQDALAMMLGVTRQTLSRELKALAQAGIISIGYRSIDILSFEALERCGDAN